MTPRTLVVGIALPHVTFDNYSFLSAPAFSDYSRLVVEMSAVSRVVDEVISAKVEHRTFAGQLVHNAPTTATAFSLADLLEMRGREAAWFLSRGGTIACLAYPDASHPGIAGGCSWSRYSWLPSPTGFEYRSRLLPAFGTAGALQSIPGHPFAGYVEDLMPRLAYRATIDESVPGFGEFGAVFIRTRAGAAAGAELAVEGGRVVLLPPVLKPESDRAATAEVLFRCFERRERQEMEEGTGNREQGTGDD